MELSFRTLSKRIGVSGALTRVSSVFGSFSTVSVRDKPVENRLAKQLPQQLVRYAKLERNNLFFDEKNLRGINVKFAYALFNVDTFSMVLFWDCFSFIAVELCLFYCVFFYML